MAKTRKNPKKRAKPEVAPPSQDFPNRIATKREEAGLSQEAVAERLGVRQPTISRWEKGQRPPRVEDLVKIAAIIGCNWVEFYLPTIIPRDRSEERLLTAYRKAEPGTRTVMERALGLLDNQTNTAAAD